MTLGNRISRVALAAVVGVGGLAFLAPSASASTSSNGCVVLYRFDTYESNGYTYKRAVVHNNCGSRQSYKIDIPYRVDPTYCVAAYTTEYDTYGSVQAGTDTARKIYGGGAC